MLGTVPSSAGTIDKQGVGRRLRGPALSYNDKVSGSRRVTDPSRAVFLSYASEDASAAQRIAEALRSGGIEVWYDREELRGGDAWDRQIRERIHECRLFIAVISAHTEARDEGYFRREWKLAVDRTHDMAEDRAFLVPVAIDATSERSARVPDSFKHVQWTRLPGGETPQAFIERARRLLSPGQPDTPTNADPLGRPAAAEAAAGSRTSDSHRRAVLMALAALVIVVALGYFAVERLVRSKPTAQAMSANSIAVLPLANESGDASQQYFSDGISEDLITALSQFPGLKVIGRTSSFQFRDSKDDSKTIGAKLGVARLLEGSVRHAGDIVRVSAELIDTSDGSTQWSDRYDRPYKDLFALQDDITRAVAGALKARLLPGQNASAQSDRPPSGNLEAYNAVLEGKQYFARSTEADTRRAIERFGFATQLDARYALAWSLLSRSWAFLAGRYLDVAPAKAAYARARAAANTALTLAPDLASAHLAQGRVLQLADFDWQAAAAEFHRGLDLAPADVDAKFYLGEVLATLGQVNKAIELYRQGLASDPLDVGWYAVLGSFLVGVDRLDEAEATLRKAIALQPDGGQFYAGLALIEVWRGNAKAALAAAQQEPERFDRDVALAAAQQIGGDRAAADAALKGLIDQYATYSPYWVAWIYALRKDPDKTFEWLDNAWRERDTSIGGLLYDPVMLRFKDDPRFAAFCRKVGLPVHGQSAGT